MKSTGPLCWACLLLAAVTCPALAAAPGDRELGSFDIAEPLGMNWQREWVFRDATIDTGGREVAISRLRLTTSVQERLEEAGKRRLVERRVVLPAQFHDAQTGGLLGPATSLRGQARVKVLFAAVLPRNKTQAFTIAESDEAPPWHAVEVEREGTRTTVRNGCYELELDAADPRPLNAIRLAGGRGTMGTFHWPEGLRCTGVEDRWLEHGPARAILERSFAFEGPPPPEEFARWAKPRQGLHYVVRFDFRAEDPWLDVMDHYCLGAGSSLRLDLASVNADFVYHPHTYNARTFKPDGKAEDSTLQPPQHPIATLGPIWRDIWFGGGPLAFVYNSQADRGLGLAAVRGSEWQSPNSVPLESQNLFVHGQETTPGKVRVEVPTDCGRGRRWSMVPGPAELRRQMERLVRGRADVQLQTVLDEWVLDWDSPHGEHAYGFAGQWFGTFNRHILNPTTFPRRVGSHLSDLVRKGQKVKSRDLAMLAYVFSDPDYWPGPRYRWRIGNPNFNTDMYNIVLQVGLVMPDHPHARRWVAHGVEELRTNVYRDSFPGGAWAESLSYSGAVFHVAEYAHMLQKAGAATPFADWPRLKEVLNYLACMHTPVDPRYAGRQKAPIGDTSPGSYVGRLNTAATYYAGVDDAFAAQLARFPKGGVGALDISSREFFGFGAMLRGNPYDERNESFVTVKAGPARNHFQGDELSLYFASLSTPLAIDYACHYSPRPWNASMHNRPDMAGKRPVAVACPRAFRTSDVADLFVADERTRRINHVPMEPHHTTKPGWEYPWSDLPEDNPWTMRRWAMLVKHDPKTARLADYLVVRDEIESPETPWWNLHVLGRRIERDGQRVHFPGQLGVDLTAHFVEPKLGRIEDRQWGWGGSMNDRRGRKGADYEAACFGQWIPEDFTPGTWKGGEMAKWLRVEGVAGRSQWLVVLLPHRKGGAAPTVEKLSPTSAKIALGDEVEIIHLGTEGAAQAAVERGGKRTVLLKAGQVKPPSQLDFKPIPAGIDKGAL